MAARSPINDTHHENGELNSTSDATGPSATFSLLPPAADDGLNENLQQKPSTNLLPTASIAPCPRKIDKKVQIVDDEELGPKSRPVPESESTTGQQAFRVYPQRWFILCVVSLLNCSNSWSWIGYAPVSNLVDSYYKSTTATYLSLVYLVAAIPVAFVALWSVRRFGLRLAVLLAVWTNGIGALIRLLSSAIPNPGARYVVLLGQTFAAVAYPFIMGLPTKVAVDWFDDRQRATATMIAAMSNPFGVFLANLISPQLVLHKDDVVYLNILLSVVPVLVLLLATFGVHRSVPPSPPGHSAATETLPFLAGLKRAMKSRAFLALCLALGGGMGMFNCMYTVMQQVLCARGYDNRFAGLCCILMIVCGLIGATVSAQIVDRTKRNEETMKISFGLAVLGGITFSVLATRSNLAPAVALCCALFGFFGLAAYPIGLETGAECTYPTAETTSTGLIVLSGQIQGALYIVLFGFLSTPLTDPAALAVEQCTTKDSDSKEANKPKDFTAALITFAAVSTALAVVFTLLFKPRMKRRNFEQQGKKKPNETTVAGNRGDFGIVEMKVIRPGKDGLDDGPDEQPAKA